MINTPKFLNHNGTTYRILNINIYGVWAIEYDVEQPKAPIFFSESEGWLQATPAPDAYLAQMEKPLTPSQEERLNLIQPLLDNDVNFMYKDKRLELAEKIATEKNTTSRRVLRLYYRFLATGVLTLPKNRPQKENKLFDWAIRTYYFTAKKLSLKATYEMMLLQKFTDANGALNKAEGLIPTWSSFQHYFYANGYHKNPQKLIARDGLTNYQRNQKPIYGS